MSYDRRIKRSLKEDALLWIDSYRAGVSDIDALIDNLPFVFANHSELYTQEAVNDLLKKQREASNGEVIRIKTAILIKFSDQGYDEFLLKLGAVLDSVSESVISKEIDK